MREIETRRHTAIVRRGGQGDKNEAPLSKTELVLGRTAPHEQVDALSMDPPRSFGREDGAYWPNCASTARQRGSVDVVYPNERLAWLVQYATGWAAIVRAANQTPLTPWRPAGCTSRYIERRRDHPRACRLRFAGLWVRVSRRGRRPRAAPRSD